MARREDWHTIASTVYWRVTPTWPVPHVMSPAGTRRAKHPVDGGGDTEPPTGAFAEASTAPPADFTATVTVPTGLQVLATGTKGADGRYTASAVPERNSRASEAEALKTAPARPESSITASVLFFTSFGSSPKAK